MTDNEKINYAERFGLDDSLQYFILDEFSPAFEDKEGVKESDDFDDWVNHQMCAMFIDQDDCKRLWSVNPWAFAYYLTEAFEKNTKSVRVSGNLIDLCDLVLIHVVRNYLYDALKAKWEEIKND